MLFEKPEKICFLFPFKAERDALFPNVQMEALDKDLWRMGSSANLVAICGQGKVSVAVALTKLAASLTDVMFILCGSSAGLRLEIPPGTLTITQMCTEIDFKPAQCGRGRPVYKTDLKELNPGESFKPVHMLSGDFDLQSQAEASELVAQWGGDTFSWESAGFFRAARLLNLRVAEIRVVCDHGDFVDPQSYAKSMAKFFEPLQKIILCGETPP
jgi:hypothetical protein